MIRTETKLMTAGVLAVGIVLSTVVVVAASSRTMFNQKLAATAGAPSKAAGKASVNIHFDGRNGTQGSFTVLASHLARNGHYDVIVGGVKVGTIKTNGGGNGRAAFSTTPRGATSLLGFDPRGATVLLRDSTPGTSTSGTDVLVGTIPDDTTGSQACCLPTTDPEGETECESLDPTACTNAGGTTPVDATGAAITSCLPDPCNPTAPPPGNAVIACCINSTHGEGTETQCEDYTETDCATAGGIVVQVPGVTPGENPCDLTPNPCQASVPPSTTPSLCCVPHTGSTPGESEPPECEDLTADACAAAGGTAPANGVCDYTDPSGVSAPVPCP